MVSGNNPDSPGLDDLLKQFKDLPESEQRAVAERLAKIKASNWKPFWCPDPNCTGDPHPLRGPMGNPLIATDLSALDDHPHGEYDPALGGWPLHDPKWAHNHARVDQRLPPWKQKWTLLVMSGRGSGKTRMGVEFVTLSARKGLDGAILGRRGTELVNTHVAEIMANAHPDFMPTYWASKDLLEWPEVTREDGVKVKPITYLFSAEKPENIRSINISYAWVDEASFMELIKTAYMNLQLAARAKVKGNPIHFLITSTPTPTEWTMKMEDDAADPVNQIILRRVSTFMNAANLDPEYLEMLRREYEGTRMGRQELHGEVLRDVEGALWNDSMFKHLDCKNASAFEDVIDSMDARVVTIDPAGSKKKRADDTGIMAVGAQHFDENDNRLRASNMFVLLDGTISKAGPTEWCRRAYTIARLTRAHYIAAEKNFGGDMVKQVMLDHAKKFPEEAINPETGDQFQIRVIHAVQGKETRAEGAVGKYEQGRVIHVKSPGEYGDLSKLEKEQCTWVPKSRGGSSPSPNRVDAVVWGIREVDLSVKYDTQMASGSDAMKMIKRSVSR